MEILEAETKDLSRILSLINSEFPYTKTTLAQLRERLAAKQTFILKAVEGRKFAGFVEFWISNSTGIILGLGVEKEFRNRAIGSRLAEAAIERLIKCGVKEIRLLVRKDNEAAKKIYVKAGFRFSGSRQKKVGGKVVEEMVLENPESAPAYAA